MKHSREDIVLCLNRHGGNVSAASRELGLTRSTVRHHVAKLGVRRKMVSGSVSGTTSEVVAVPKKGEVTRYIVTSAQNNTRVHQGVWDNLLALAKLYKARILVGTFSYNQNAFGRLSVKKDTEKAPEKDLWYDPQVVPYFSDKRMQLAPGLVWCGEMNILPTAQQPLTGLETYSGRQSAIFPHAKLAMQSIAAMRGGDGAKINYTTGCCTQMNYVQKRAGLIAEHHHTYGGLIVEVNSEGHWWVRQLEADKADGEIHDLLHVVKGGVPNNTTVEAITWGDLHAACVDPKVVDASLEMLSVLLPKYQFIHDLLEGASVNHHAAKDPHAQFATFLRGYDSVESEISETAKVLGKYVAALPSGETIVVASNHDSWLRRWLREKDYRSDPRNALLFLRAQTAVYEAMAGEEPDVDLMEWAIRYVDPKLAAKVRFLGVDESFLTCNKKIENSQHGHLGPNGSRGNSRNLSKVGRKSNTAHSHSAGIFGGLFVAGASCDLHPTYAAGPSSWSHSHIITYRNGRRAIVTMYDGKWRA